MVPLRRALRLRFKQLTIGYVNSGTTPLRRALSLKFKQLIIGVRELRYNSYYSIGNS
jgi:hypothetical protein